MRKFSTPARLTLALAFFMFVPFWVAQAAIRYVKADAAGANNGTSWADAYTSLQSALTVAVSGDEIWVAAGVYKPSVAVDVDASGTAETREMTFQVPAGVQLYGGFAGMEVTRNARNWILNRTILSGDIDNNDTNLDANFMAESTADIIGNNAYHVLYTRNVTASTILDGFVITAGRAFIASPPNPNVPNLDGGGWYNHLVSPVKSSSPTVRHCVFQGNYAESEGAAFYSSLAETGAKSSPVFADCQFTKNKANRAGGAIYIGSFQKGSYKPVVQRCTFTENEARRSGGALFLLGDTTRIDTCTFRQNKVTVVSPDGSTLPGSGGAITMVSSNASFLQTLFISNSATGNPTGFFEGGGGGAVYMSTNEPQTASLGESKPRFVNCGFYSNTAAGNTTAWGGAAVHLNDAGILKVTYINCVFAGNSATNHGGAVANFARVISPPSGYSALLQVQFTNATLTGNTAASGGGLYSYLAGGALTTRLENTIVSGNTASSSAQVFNDAGVSALVTYSLVQGSGGSGGGWNTAIGTDGGHNLDASPGFTNVADPDGADNIPATTDDGLRPLSGSVVINAGNSLAAGLVGISKDFTGENRLIGTNVEIGAYERAGWSIPKFKIYWLVDWRPFRPICLSCPWAIRFNWEVIAQPQTGNGFSALAKREASFVWKTPAKLTNYGDSATVTGQIVSLDNSAVQFDVYLKLTEGSNWEAWQKQQRTYDFNTPEAAKAARLYHTRWKYWVLSADSYLKGSGKVEGILTLQHAPKDMQTGFQLGIGGNAQDADLGLSGEFYLKGILVYGQTRQQIRGTGSLNADASLCEERCEAAQPPSNPVIPQPYWLKIYPVPAHSELTLESLPGVEGVFTYQLFDMQGNVWREGKLNTATSLTVSLKGIRSGLYRLQVQAADSLVQYYKVIIQ